MVFWIISSGLALVVAGIMAMTVLRPRADNAAEAAEFDLQVYRDQLKEVDRDLARGVITENNAERVRTEVSRRILAADAQRKASLEGGSDSAPKSAGIVAVAALAATGIGAVALYSQIGAPGYGDQPLKERIAMAAERAETRPSQSAFEATLPPREAVEPDPQYQTLMKQLREKAAENPDDLQGQQLLARNEGALGNLPAAYAAQANVIRIKGDDASAHDFMIHADMLITAAQGYVSPEAEASLRSALALDHTNQTARYYVGLMFLQNDRPDLTFVQWERLLQEGPHDAPWIRPIRAQIEEVAWRAGVKYQLPPVPEAPQGDGPSREDMEAAAELSAQERQDMIRGMVDRLSDRLATEGGSAEEWARLIGALGVLGDSERAQAIWGEAQTVFASQPEALEMVRQAAQKAGLVQ